MRTAPEEVVVTGSRIPTAVGDLNPNVTVISAGDIESRGYRNAFDALNNLTQNTGFTQGADFGNTFTPAANTVSLRGLGPNHTLVLINGQRQAEYPVPYNGSVNFVNLANIPSAAIDRIEVLNGGASAIYGSDAIAGVVNIILKDHVDGLDVNLKAGTTEHGGGTSTRFQAFGGRSFDRLSTVFGVEVSRVEPVWAGSRDFMSSTTLQGAAPTAIWSRRDLTTNRYVDPPDGCAPFAGDFQGGTTLHTGATGSFCGSGRAQPTYWTTQTGNQAESLYGSVKYDLTDRTQLFVNALVGWNTIWNNTRGRNWTSNSAGDGYFLNQATGDYEVWSRRLAPEEIGGAERSDNWWHELSGTLSAGITGPIGSGTWKYTATYSGSVNSSNSERPQLLSGIDSYFLGPQLGTDGSSVPIYAPDPTHFNQPLTPAIYNTLSGTSITRNNSWFNGVSVNAHGEVVDLPAGPLSAAVAVEWGTQGFTNHPDPRLGEGVFSGVSAGTPVSGTRQHHAGALELRVPVLSTLDVRVAGRYDEYEFADRSEGKPTYNASLEYHPVKQLRIHGSYGTSFRAPDMSYIFQAQSRGYFASTTDYYRCAQANQPLSDCEYTNYSPGANYTQRGGTDLGFEEGRSFDAGVEISPIPAVQVSVDYWNLRIDNEVTLLDADNLLRTEAACRAGQLDPSTPQCLQAVSLVQRNPPNAVLDPNAITNITIFPINAAYERTDGIDIGARVNWRLEGIGDFHWNTTFTRVMSHYYQQAAGDQPLDLVRSLDNPNGSDFPDKLTSTLDWSLRNYSATVEVDRYGSIVNEAVDGFLTPTTLVNLSAQYRFGNATVSVIVDNVFDTVKKDASAGWPFYAVGYFMPYGRQGWVEVNYHF